MTRCPSPPCDYEATQPGILAGHLRSAHHVPAGEALRRARAALGIVHDTFVEPSLARRAEADHATLVAAGVPSDEQLDAVIAAAQPEHRLSFPYRKLDNAGGNVTAPTSSHSTKEPTMATKSHKADPAACKFCARLSTKAGKPVKCKWHGGADRSTAHKGQGPDARSTAPLVAKFAFPGLVAHLDTEILSTQARLDKLKELRQSAVELGA